MSMDIIETYTLLEDGYNYFNLTKNEFVRGLDAKFKKHQFLNDVEFYLSLNEYYKCNKDEMTCQFVGRESRIGTSIYFEIKNSQLTGIQFCDAYGKVEDLNEYYD